MRLLYFFSLFFLFSCIACEEFTEELLIRPLTDGNIFSHIQFTSHIEFNPMKDKLNHFSIFPKSIAQVIQKFQVEQLQLLFTQGSWKEDKWGIPIIDSASGVQLTSSFLSSDNAKDNWSGLIHSLAGMFCASLGVLDETASADPHYSYTDMVKNNEKLDDEIKRSNQLKYQQELLDELENAMKERGEEIDGTIQEYNEISQEQKIFALNFERITKNRLNPSKSKVFYGEMPEEAVCTENLTPWIKLLPCRSESGLGTLLNSLYLYNTLYHSMGVTTRYLLPDHCSNVETCDHVTLELIQTLSIVFQTENTQEYEISKLYGSNSLSKCILSNSKSHIYIQIPSSLEDVYTLSPIPTEKINDLNIYSINDAHSLKITKNNEKLLKEPIYKSPVSIKRNALGRGDAHGEILTQVYNPTDEDLSITYFEYVPWYFTIYFHSLRVFFNEELLSLPDVATKWRFQPGEDHSTPNIMEIEFILPAKTTVSFIYSHDKSFLLWTEHPPDAHRGSDIASACVTVHYDKKPDSLIYSGIDWSPKLYNQSKIQEQSFEFRTYSEGLLILLPTPDFSMPYNVITLTCTMFAIIFTTTINVLTRRFSYLSKGGEYSSGRLSMFLYRKIRDFITK